MSSVVLSQLVIETPTLSMFFLFNVFCTCLVAAICLLRFLKSEYVLAWISFRTIDVMSVISAVEFIPGLNNKRMVESAIDTVKFVVSFLLPLDHYLRPEKHRKFKYSIRALLQSSCTL